MTVLHERYGPDTHFAEMFSFPQRQTGNHAIGIVDDVGEDVRSLQRGDRVFIRKAHASQWVLPSIDCSRIPDLVEDASALWAGFAKTAFRAAQAAPFKLGGEALVIGGGPVGQLAVRWAAAAGLRRIILCDASERRLEHAPMQVETHCGAVNEKEEDLLAVSGGDGFATIIDSTGNAAVFETALSLAAPFGTIVLLGDTGYPAHQCLTSDAMKKGVSIVATHESLPRDGWRQQDVDTLFFTLVERTAIDVSGMITHRFTPERYEDAYKLAARADGAALGIVFDWPAS